jgi:uncharacterized OB-fold protein
MSWTVACFCGNIYTTPPDCCEVCGRSTEPALEVAPSEQLHTVAIATALATTREPQPAPLAMRRDEKSSPVRMAAATPGYGTVSRRSPAASGRHWV